MRSLTFVFGEKEVQIAEPTFGQAKVWRAKLEARLTELAGLAEGDLTDILKEAAALQVPTSAQEATKSAQAGEFDRAAGVIARLSPTLGQVAKLALNSVDEAADLLFSYGPELMKRREELEDTAYNDEIVNALWVVVKSAYPFSTITNLIQGLMDQFGQLQGRTSTNSPALNGAKETIKA